MQQKQQLTNEQLKQRRDRMIRDHDRRAGPDRAPPVACWAAREDPSLTKRLATGARAKSSICAQSHVRTLCKPKTAHGYAKLDHTWVSCKLWSDIPRRQHGRTTDGAACHDVWRTTSRWSDVAGACKQTIWSDDSKIVPFTRVRDYLSHGVTYMTPCE